jgi:arylsulfatase A-like enzyme
MHRRRPRGRRGIGLPGLALLGVLACDPTSAPESAARPSLLLISVDTLRPDHLGCYGYPRDTSPHLDALAARGTLFERAVSPAPWTLPAHASIFTGAWPGVHALQEDGNRLGRQWLTFPQRLRDAGYATLAVVSHFYVSSEFGFDRGFDRYDDGLTEGGTRNPIAGEVVDRALELLADPPAGPFFLFLHFFDPHWDYTPPPPWNERFTDPAYAGPVDGTLGSLFPFAQPDTPWSDADRRQTLALYDGEIAYLDAQIGRLLAALAQRGLLEDTLVVFTADHGEEFKERGSLGHARTLYGEQLRVPLLIAGHEAFPAGARRDDLVSTVDLAPTLLALAGAEPLPGADGRSLLAAPRGDGEVVIGSTLRYGESLRALRDRRFKLVHDRQSGEHRYFDLAADPGEQRPLAEDPSGGRLAAALARHAARVDRGWHLALVSREGQLAVRGAIRSEGRLLDPQRHFWNQGRYPGSQLARFDRFELSEDARTLMFQARLSRIRGEIWFRTEPADARVAFELETAGGDAPVRLADGAPLLPGSGPLAPDDPRLAPRPGRELARGVHVVSVGGADEPAPPLSPETLEHLRALGYAEQPAGAP